MHDILHYNGFPALLLRRQIYIYIYSYRKYWEQKYNLLFPDDFMINYNK